MKNVFIIGSKGIPANYGGFETFVEKLTEGKKDDEIKYHVACMSNNNNEFEYNDNKFSARSFVKLNRYNMLGKASILYLENFIQIDE